MGLAYGRVEIRQKLVAEVEVLAADLLDLGVVEILGRGKKFGVILNGSGVAAVPAPREAKHPGAAMRSEERAEGAKLEPADIEFGGELLCRKKPPVSVPQ
jgi:uncharacterized protein YbjT (DUF2867 family)